MSRRKQFVSLLLLLLACLGVSQLPVAAQAPTSRVYLPLIGLPRPPSIFGTEATLYGFGDTRVLTQARNLGAYWMRVNGVEWSKVEPARGAPYNWAALAQIDAALASLKTLGMTPVVIVRGTPDWASVTGSGCAAIQDAYIADFANFMAALVQRYGSQVAYWEMGNEPDVDPIWVPSNSPYGCWGDIRDTYYGGERYGRMLRAVVPAMRAANPSVKIVLGGLLLDTPNTTDPTRGKPERFLEGVLRSGAADSFDIVAYHAYTSYTQPNFDHDLNNGADWPPRGGWTLGKAAYVRDVLARYGVSKPLWLNETSMVCSPTWSQCDPPGDEFFAAQADHLIRVMTRAAAANIQQISWFTFNGPGWRNGSLLDTNQSPRPSFTAYKRLIEMVGQYQSVSAVDYGQEIEAYRFVKPGGVVDVLWSRSASTVIALVPSGSYRSAVIWNGAEPSTGTSPDGTQKYVNVGFQAVFIERAP